MIGLRGRARAFARHGALDVLAWHSRGEMKTALERPRVHLPYLHTVARANEKNFRRLIETLAESHHFISYSNAVDRIHHGPIDRPYVAFSFDDGFKSNVRTAKILEEYGIRGMFFVPANFIGTTDRQRAERFFAAIPPSEEGAMTWDDLGELRDDGHEIGNHTFDHRVLAWVDEAEMHRQIELGAEALRTNLGDVRHFAWPRGQFQHFSASAARAVFSTGHVSCASAERGAHALPSVGLEQSICLRRDHLMAEWPLRHMLYFLSRSSNEYSSRESNHWPKDWHVPH